MIHAERARVESSTLAPTNNKQQTQLSNQDYSDGGQSMIALKHMVTTLEIVCLDFKPQPDQESV